MNHQLFSKSDLHSRAAIVFCDGDYIASIKEYAFKISLFIIDSTYVEVFYNAHSNKIEDIAIMEAN